MRYTSFIAVNPQKIRNASLRMRMTCPLLLKDQILDSIILRARLFSQIFHQDFVGHIEHFPYLGIERVNLTSTAAILLSFLKIALTLCMMNNLHLVTFIIILAFNEHPVF